MTFKTAKNYSHHRVMIPMHTRDTAGMGHGMPQCAKIDYRTRTCTTRFGKPVGFPVPVANPKGQGFLFIYYFLSFLFNSLPIY